MDKLTEEMLKEFDEIGFGNQARIVGVKRVELKDFLRSRIDTLLQKEREAGKRELTKLLTDELLKNKSHELKSDNRKCYCVYNNEVRVGKCLRCVNNELYAMEKGKNKTIDEAIKTIERKLSE